MVALEGAWGINLEVHQFHRSFIISWILLISVRHRVLSFEGGFLSTVSSRACTLASTCRSWFSSHGSCGVNWISKQSAIAFAFSDGRNLRPEALWIAVSALCPSLVRRDFAMGHIAWGVTSALPIFVSHRSGAFFSGHASDSFRDPIDCRFTCWIPCFLPQFS
jgi:hypothetical protein